MSTDTFTHKDLSDITGVSVTTIKSYRKKFPEFFFISGHGKPLRFRKGADKLCLRIRELFGKNLSVKQIRDKLSLEFESVKDKSNLPITENRNSFDNADFEKLARTTTQMMNGLAALVTAQAKSEQRLMRIEKSLRALIENQAEAPANNAAFDEILSAVNELGNSLGQERLTARKVVTIKKDNGKHDSYTFDSESSPAEPEKDFLDLPVVIRSENGEFLGMPGKPGHPFTLEELIFLITRRKEQEASSVWRKDGRDWILSFKSPEGPLNELFFHRTKTPKGNIVSFFERMDIDSTPQSPSFILTFFREVRDLIDSE